MGLYETVKQAVYLNPNRGSAPLQVTVYELPEEQIPSVSALTSFSQAKYFEEVVLRYKKEYQGWLEQQPEYRRPSELAATETVPFVGGETLEEWLAKQPPDVIEEFETVETV